MTFEEAKAELKDGYLKVGYQLIEEHQKELYISHRDEVLKLDEEEIQEYADCKQLIGTLETKPSECSACGPTFREHLVRPIDPVRGRLLFFGDNKKYAFGDSSLEETYVEISQASMVFVNYFRFDESYLRICKERIARPFLTRTSGTKRLKDTLFRPPTISVWNLSAPDVQSAIKQSNQLIEACLFSLSYGKNLPLRLVDEWPVRRLAPRRHFTYGGRVPGYNFSLPAVSYNSDIFRFYQLGMSSDIPVLQFLAFYQVLEYFFISVSDEQLYSKLSNRLNDFKFRTTPSQLDRVILDVLEHNRTTDETEMLKGVISKYVNEAELIGFITQYEEYLNEKIYTKKRERFGVEIEVKLTPGHVIGNIAKIIKTVRNALVHSSDRYERNVRHVPFSKSSEIVEKEVPLVKFLAERVIIATAT